MTLITAPGPIPPIDNATFVADKDHHQVGRAGYTVELLALHDSEGISSGHWLSTGSPGGESAHHLYGRDGTRYDPVHRQDTAYHTGVAAWGRWAGSVGNVAVCNLVSIGHEFESTATALTVGNGYTASQLYTAAYTIAGEMVGYGLDWSRVVTHAQIALPPGRKHDPSHFPMQAFQQQVYAWLRFFKSLAPTDVPHWII